MCVKQWWQQHLPSRGTHGAVTVKSRDARKMMDSSAHTGSAQKWTADMVQSEVAPNTTIYLKDPNVEKTSVTC